MSDRTIKPFDPYGANTTYSHLGKNFGNPMVNMMMSMAFGHNLMPAIDDGQSNYDAFIQRQRSQHFMQLQRSGAVNNQLFKAMGINNNPLAGMVSSAAMSSPDSALGRLMSPLLGGNPMAASMQLYGGLTGASTMGNFGRIGNISVGETESTMAALTNNIYKSQNYEGPGGVREELNAKARKRVQDLAGDAKNDDYLKAMGIHVQRYQEGPQKGELTKASADRLASFSVAGSSQENEEGDKEIDKIRNNISVRRMTSESLRRGLSDVMNTDSTSKDIDTKLKALKDNLEKELHLNKEQIAEIFEESSKGVISMRKGGAAKAEKAISGFSKLDEIEQDVEKADMAKEAGKRFKGYNFENSRGFKIEDFTSAFTQASRLRGLGESRGVSPADKMSGFSANAGGALSAARSLFGNQSGGELVSKISDMMGEDMDLSTKEGSGAAEKLLRDVKATADVAGISIKTMLSIIDSTKELAANNPRLSSISSQAITKMAVGAASRASSIGAAMSSKESRQAGGDRGILADETQTTNAFLDSGYSRQVAAISALTKGLGDFTDEKGNKYNANQKFLDMLKSGEISPEDFTSGEAFKKVQKLTQGKLDVNTQLNAGMSDALVKAGMADTETAITLGEVKNETVANTGFKQLEQFGAASKDELVAALKEEKAKAKRGEKSMSVQEIFNSKVLGKVAGTAGEEYAVQYGSVLRNKLIEEAQLPEERERFEKKKRERADKEAELDKAYAANYSPISQQFLDAMIGNETFEGKAEAVANILATTDEMSAPTKAAVEKARAAGEKLSTISAASGGNQEALKEKGFSAALNELMAGRKAMMGEKGANLRSDMTDAELEEIAQGLGDITEASTPEGAKKRLAQLEKQKASGGADWEKKNAKLAKQLRILKGADALDISKSASGLAGVRANRSLESLAAGVLSAQKEYNVSEVLDKEKNKSLTALGETLGTETAKGDKDTDEALQFYASQLNTTATDPRVIQQMYEDYSKKESNQRGGKNWFSTHKLGEGSALGEALTSTQEAISATEEKLKTPTKGGKDGADGGPNKALIDAMTKLAESIKDGGGIGEALGQIATTLKTIN